MYDALTIPPHIVLDEAHSPADIEARSFAIIDEAIPEPRPFAGPLWQVARRCVHTLGDTDIVHDLRLNACALERGLAALRAGCTVFTDTRMAADGMPTRRLAPLGVTAVPLMALPGIEETARTQGITRSRAAMLDIASRWAGAIVVVGNAPTALLTLLDLVSQGTPPPALVVGMPVGFVNAAQSKVLLHESGLPHFTLLGNKGGSAVAAACVNAMADMVLAERGKNV